MLKEQVVDNFLQDQMDGEVIDTKNEFTVERSQSREKLLGSIPPSFSMGYARMLKGANFRLRSRGLSMPNWERNGVSDGCSFVLNLTSVEPKIRSALLHELKRPFSTDPATSLLAKALFRATKIERLRRPEEPKRQSHQARFRQSGYP